MQRTVIPRAMIAGGFAGSPEQATAFVQGYVDGWKRLEADLNHDPKLRPYLKIDDVLAMQEGMARYEASRLDGPASAPAEMPPMDPFEEPFRYEVVDQAGGADGAVAAPEIPEPTIPASVEVTRVDPPRGGIEVRRAVEERRDESERIRIERLAQPMDAEEIAAAAAPVPEAEPVVLGSVMGPDFVPASKRGQRGLQSGDTE